MKKFDTHLCLVSAQAIPNLIPVLDKNIAPRRVVLAVSPDMKKRGEWLADVMKRHQLTVETIGLVDAFDYLSCWETLAEWLSQQHDTVALNVTGGTKVMAMAAQDVFREMNKPVFYINVENDSVLQLDRKGEPITLPTKIKLRDFLESHGYKLTDNPHRPEIKAEERDFVNRLACESGRLGGALGRLNWLAQQAEGRLRSPALGPRDQGNKALDKLLGWFSGERLLKIDNNEIQFPNEGARKFVNGGWLEFLVFQALANLSPKVGLADYHTGLTVVAPDGKTKNELDAAFLYQNTLHLIECKSANLSATSRDGDSAATDALYKLDVLRNMGGLRTRAMLVDFRGGLSDADKRRAAQMDIQIISGSQLRNLEGEIKSRFKMKEVAN